MSNIRLRIMRLEKQAGIGPSGETEMSDSELIAGLRRMFRADPDRRWEDEMPMGHMLMRLLEEARAADDRTLATRTA